MHGKVVDDLGGDGVRLVLDVDHRVLAQASHPPEQELRVAVDELRPGLTDIDIDTAIFRPATFIEQAVDDGYPVPLSTSGDSGATMPVDR